MGKSKNDSKQRKELEDQEQKHFIRAQRTRDDHKRMQSLDRALRNGDIERLTEEDTYYEHY